MKLLLFFLLVSSALFSQYRWEPRDPLDLSLFDIGDNKNLLYNGLGIGAVFIFDKHGTAHRAGYWEVGISHQARFRNKEGGLKSAFIERRFWVREYVSIIGRVKFIRASEGSDKRFGVGMIPLVSWHFIRGKSVEVAFQSGVGPNLFFSPFPEMGTNLNFSTQYGVRILSRSARIPWSITLLSHHLSNADIKGSERNPSFDSWGVAVGYRL